MTAPPAAGAASIGRELPRFSPIVRGGLVVGGSGTFKASCDGADCENGSTDSVDYSHKLAFALGADFLWRLGSLMRLGPGVMYTAGESVKLESGYYFGPHDENEPSVGSDLALDAVLEIVPQVGSSVWLAPNLRVGGGVFFPGGDFADQLDNTKTQCSEAGGASGCDTIGDPSIGWNIGLGFGVIFSVSDLVRLRADVLAQYYSFSIYSVSLDSPLDATYSEKITSSRGFLFFGVEF